MSDIEFKNEFFGRKLTVDLMKKRLLGLKEGYRQNIALLGHRFVGKSTTLHRFICEFDDPDIVNIYIDLSHKDIDYFFSKFIGSILYNYSKLEGLPLHEDINLLIESTKKHIPETTKVITKVRLDLSQGKTSESYRALMSLPEIFTSETNKFCVLIIDEFQKLEEYGIDHVFKELGKKIMTQKRCLYIIASSYPEAAQKIIAEKLSLLFGNFEMVHVEPFDLKTSLSFIRHSLGNIRIGSSLCNFLIDFTAGYPLYLSLILKELKHLCAIHKQEGVYIPLLVQAIENTIFNEWGLLSRHFELIVDGASSSKGNRIGSSILINLANNGKQKLKDLSKGISIKQHLVSQKVNRLVEEGVIVKNGQFFYLEDKLFRYWIKYVFQKRLKAFDLDSNKQCKIFIDEVHHSIEQFKLDSKKDLSSRIVELLYCFDNEALRVNGRKYKLPVFNKIVPLKPNEQHQRLFDIIKASNNEGHWYVIFKRGPLAENDVNTFLMESKRGRTRAQRCIVISLSQLDENTRLKALQEKMWIWSEGELNQLLNFYDKPYIVQ